MDNSPLPAIRFVPNVVLARGALFVVLLLGTAVARAHFPSLSDGSATSPQAAIQWDDPQVSRVVYHELTAAVPQVWVTFEVDGPQTLLVQLGVPLIERLRAYRPALALLGRGLPAVSLPFEVPEGLGGLIFDSAAREGPREFYEPFSGTSSWIWVDEQVALPAAGRYYIVAYHPAGEPGKVWAATGEREVFSVSDLPFLTRIVGDIRNFHEVPAGAAPPCFLLPAAAGLAGWTFVRGRRAWRGRMGA